jgi:DNA-binding response OmpR family regulator
VGIHRTYTEHRHQVKQIAVGIESQAADHSLPDTGEAGSGSIGCELPDQPAVTLKRSLPRGYRFGNFFLDIADRQLLFNGSEVFLRPKAFETLLCLVERHGRLVSKDDLLDTVWPDGGYAGCSRSLHYRSKEGSSG